MVKAAAKPAAYSILSLLPIMPRKNLTDGLGMLKVVFELAEKGLTGIGIPGVEPIAGVPLTIIRYYEVCCLLASQNGLILICGVKTVRADKAAMDDLASSLESLYNALLAPIRDARNQGLSKVPEDLRARIISLAK